MTRNIWVAVDQYLDGLLVGHDEALESALRASDEAGLPAINVAAMQGKLLHLLARIRGARAILEVGTLGGYSTIWMARALPADGRLVTLEIDKRHADVARANIARAGLAQQVQVRLGPALDLLAQLGAERAGPFDLTFIDADKENNPAYFEWALRLSRPGSVIVVDNVVRGGAVTDADSTDPSVQGVRRLNQMMASDPRVSATTIQTVCAKGYDGFALALVNSI
jgi:predicted O-methyltransferase YrrM